MLKRRVNGDIWECRNFVHNGTKIRFLQSVSYRRSARLSVRPSVRHTVDVWIAGGGGL